MDNKKLTRRDFLRTAGMAASASLLAACSTKEVIKTEIVKEIVKETQIVKEEVEVEKVVTEVVKETQIVKEEVEKIVEVTPTPLPTMPPEPIVMDVWFNTDIPDIDAEWAPDPDNTEFQKQWYFGGLGRAIFKPWLEKHPGVSMKITTHSWDSELRQNQLMSLAAGIIPDTTYGEAYVNEFVQLGVYSPLNDDVVALFADGSSAGSKVDGKTYGIPKSSGADVLFINLTLWEQAGLDRNKLPTTWEELVTSCKAISAINKSDIYGNT